jgi:hypothetical protein
MPNVSGEYVTEVVVFHASTVVGFYETVDRL